MTPAKRTIAGMLPELSPATVPAIARRSALSSMLPVVGLVAALITGLATACSLSGGADPGHPSDGGAGRTGDAGTTGSGGSGPGAGWRPFSDNSPWNTVIPASPAIDPMSATLISDLASIPNQNTLWINIQEWSVPVYWVDSTAVASTTVSVSLGGTGFRMGAANDSVAEGKGSAPIPSGAMAAAGEDRHLSIVDRVLGKEWGFYDARRAGGGWTAGQAATIDLGGAGVRPPERNDPWWAGHGPRACGFPLIAGLITADDIRAGAIEHALVIAYPHIRSRFYTPPASTAQGTTDNALPNRGIVCGGHIQLDPALDVTKLGLSASGLMIARALQKYGAFVGDYSGAVSLYGDASPDARTYWESGALDNNAAEAIPLNRFRVLTIGTTYDNMN